MKRRSEVEMKPAAKDCLVSGNAIRIVLDGGDINNNNHSPATANAHARDDIETVADWSEDALLHAFHTHTNGFRVLTKTNALSPFESRAHIQAICDALATTAKSIDIKYEVVFRDPSMLQCLLQFSPPAMVAQPRASHPMQYQRLGNSGLKVSRLILGCMSFGNPEWEGSPWILPEEKALPLLKKAYDVGINTWETADTYSNGQSEKIVGKALTEYGIPRSKVVIMTKLYYPVLEDQPNVRPQPAYNDGDLVNQMGLCRKHIFEAVEGSLRRLGTSYIDVLQIHRLDHDTPPTEVMKALHDLVEMGKVLYLGASSMYCWQFARLQYTAKMNSWTTFTSMSGLYNLLYREEEREMIPFCRAEGIGIIPWSPVARGLLTRPWSEHTERSKKDAKSGKWFQGCQNEEIVRCVEKLANEKQCSMSSIALAWLLHKGACPIVGLNSLERIDAASEALSVVLTDKDMQLLEALYRPLEPQVT